MLDLRLIREQPEVVKEGLRRLFEPTEIVDEILALDERRRTILVELEGLRNTRNVESKAIGRIKDPAERQEKIEAMRTVNARIAALEEELRQIEAELNDRLLHVPNLPHESVPVSPDEKDNPVVKVWGQPRTFDFPPKPHWELGEGLGIIDFERGIKVAGSRFYVLKGMGARLQRALITWMIDLHVARHGYTEVYPPFMVREACLVGTGQLPKFGDNLYHDAEEDYWMVPTAEVPVTNMLADELLDAADLPIRYVAYTPCFRREKMSAGRDVRGIKRGHQFDKVEMVKFTKPEESMHELETLIAAAEDVARALNIPYRVVQMVTGDLSFTAAIKFDVEMWAPAAAEEGEWLEVSSCSNFMDFQARRANIRYRPAPGARPEFVHTLNGSGLALPRVMIAILENYQNEDGSITIPEVVRPYMGGVERITAANALRGTEAYQP
ncbi:MAG: serine--tRNA ligase [Ardenticatenaceae bacterium]|nr:serine--tRNA ligase [Ardenticatenaceae bacterium]HBY98755.1 serine--tRNA ligase [Chloroflexota bacterium]